MTRLMLVACVLGAVLQAQDDPRIVRTSAPPECKSPVPVGINARNLNPIGLHQYQTVTVQCVLRPDDVITRSFGTATFCGSAWGGTEEKFFGISLGLPAGGSQSEPKFSCQYPSELRVLAPPRSQRETAPESERRSRLMEGLFASGLPEGEWQSLFDNGQIAVAVQRQIYGQQFQLFIHVRVSNRTGHPLGIDLRHRDQIIHPRTWELHRAVERTVILEDRAEPTKLTPIAAKRLLADFRAGVLTSLSESLDYYCGFMGRRPGGADYSGNEQYLTISTDGQLLYTDGRTVGGLDLRWRTSFGPRETDIVIPVPFQVLPLPSGALVF